MGHDWCLCRYIFLHCFLLFKKAANRISLMSLHILLVCVLLWWVEGLEMPMVEFRKGLQSSWIDCDFKKQNLLNFAFCNLLNSFPNPTLSEYRWSYFSIFSLITSKSKKISFSLLICGWTKKLWKIIKLTNDLHYPYVEKTA